MAYNEFLADRIRNTLDARKVHYEEKKMMGGLAFMVDDKMCVGVNADRLMARIDPELVDTVMSKPGCRPMDFTGRPMKGFVFVEPDGIDREAELEYWIGLCLDFNPRAKASKKK